MTGGVDPHNRSTQLAETSKNDSAAVTGICDGNMMPGWTC